MSTEEESSSKATELMKKVLTVGVGAVFLTEESLRSLVSEIKLPKEFLKGLLDSAGKTRREFLQNLSSEMIDRVMDKADPTALVEEFLHKNEVELQVKVSFSPKKKKHKNN